jgi:hypothetical protein
MAARELSRTRRGSIGGATKMSKVILDADDLDLFASQLSAFNRSLGGQCTILRGQFRRLGETWRDPQYAVFAREFERTITNLQRFQAIADEVIPMLRKKAQLARDVHR